MSAATGPDPGRYADAVPTPGRDAVPTSADSGPGPGRDASAGGRRELTYATLLCLVGAALAVWAATRTWSVEVTVRPAPLPAVRADRSGAALLPWLPALGVVALAGAGAVLATRGRLRRALGALILLLGVAVTAGGGYGLTAAFDGEVSRQWPASCLLGGVLTAVGGAWVGWRGQRWPAMGARYERPVAAPPRAGTPARGATDAWDALDRGEDPTAT
ncbi:Trp biosynthesis-associated membrane protein [Micromonospora sp. WMMD882]|uniref:Trp biosynthesis-associated membrane protein n=1 Tax=Micromonospora sp. WMMD882 TaxID=3015151 RepID=UPI00248AE4E1|nr:Trp biosynthesis-associated membrane protein [Micromonospora sp. WMMD882]WBB82244.1 Trp biosynthesis-associated membrane protein [Micromonospora sp. WMMD882]